MGAFNRYLVEQTCPGCGKTVERAFQFKFGNKWQYDYRSGDLLRWGGNDEGDPGQPLVFVDCVPEDCSNCRFDYDWSDENGFRLRIENDRLVGVEGPYEFGSLLFGSDIDLRTAKAELQSRQRALGLWTTWDGNEDYSVETHSNAGERFSLQTNSHGAREYNRSEWTGSLFLRVTHVTRREELVRLLDAAPFTLLTPDPPRHRSYTNSDDHVFFVDSREEVEDTTIYRSIADHTRRRVLVYEVGGDLPILEFGPGDGDARHRSMP